MNKSINSSVLFLIFISLSALSCQTSIEDKLKGIWIAKDNDQIGVVIFEENSIKIIGVGENISGTFEETSSTSIMVQTGSNKLELSFELTDSTLIFPQIDSDWGFYKLKDTVNLKSVALVNPNTKKVSYITLSDNQLINYSDGDYEVKEKSNIRNDVGLYQGSYRGETTLVYIDENVLLATKDLNSSLVSGWKFTDLSWFHLRKSEGGWYNGSTNAKSRDGLFISWNEDGTRTSQNLYISGEYFGYQTTWDDQGRLLSQSHYFNGEKEGYDIQFEPFDFKMVTITKYENGTNKSKSMQWQIIESDLVYREMREGGYEAYLTSRGGGYIVSNGRKTVLNNVRSLPSYSEEVLSIMSVFLPFSQIADHSLETKFIPNAELWDDHPYGNGLVSITSMNGVLSSTTINANRYSTFEISFIANSLVEDQAKVILDNVIELMPDGSLVGEFSSMTEERVEREKMKIYR